MATNYLSSCGSQAGGHKKQKPGFSDSHASKKFKCGIQPRDSSDTTSRVRIGQNTEECVDVYSNKGLRSL